MQSGSNAHALTGGNTNRLLYLSMDCERDSLSCRFVKWKILKGVCVERYSQKYPNVVKNSLYVRCTNGYKNRHV